ncbi:hypothetical protein POM88_031112 [Heracleum sosnowskyi]|uniref:Uncharacterized protein n=1 Tax=Heracleum sosnowskyi TaxID=360622 RepID=A0AAD8HWS5_9APIA|nr:hypothetical protein POM88_031112 [Heracleum sosnowskyi]
MLREIGQRSFHRSYGLTTPLPEPQLEKHPSLWCMDVRLWFRWRWELDHLEEIIMIHRARLLAYHQRTARYYNRKVRARPFRVGDLVLHRVMPNTKVVNHGVFGTNWEGPYQIKSVLWEGTYHLNDMRGKLIPRARNVEHLRKYYQ